MDWWNRDPIGYSRNWESEEFDDEDAQENVRALFKLTVRLFLNDYNVELFY